MSQIDFPESMGDEIVRQNAEIARLRSEVERLAHERDDALCDTWNRANMVSGLTRRELETAMYDMVEKLYKAEAEVERLTRELSSARLDTRNLCGVCWTSSYVPVPTEAECNLNHPHESDHARCDHCWLKGLHDKAEAVVRAVEPIVRAAAKADNSNEEYAPVCLGCGQGGVYKHLPDCGVVSALQAIAAYRGWAYEAMEADSGGGGAG